MEISLLTKDGQMIRRIEWYRWGSWQTQTDERVDIDVVNPDGYDIYNSHVNWELVDMVDGCEVQWEFPADMSETEQELLQSIYSEDGYSGLEDSGWDTIETDVIVYGPLELVPVLE